MAQRKNSGRIASDQLPQRGPSATKSGPGRKHRAGKPGNRLTKERPLRAYVALMAASASKRITKITRRDENGSYTLTGRAYFPDGTQRRRMWLAGISSQRGF